MLLLFRSSSSPLRRPPLSPALVGHLDEVVQLVEELLRGGVDLRVGGAHPLVERLVPVDGGLQGGDLAVRGLGRGGVRVAALEKKKELGEFVCPNAMCGNLRLPLLIIAWLHSRSFGQGNQRAGRQFATYTHIFSLHK